MARKRESERGIVAMSEEPGKHNMVLTRVFDAPIEQVWHAWSDSGQVMQWWGPTGFTAPVARMDFREGGTSLVCMKAPPELGGQEWCNTWTYQRIVPTQRIEFTASFVDKEGSKVAPADQGLSADIPFEVPHLITFRALGDTQTELTVTEYGYSSEQTVEMSRAGMNQCLDKMAALFERHV
jgi:uncharacterized protein YndB with AHSA1/START domain